MEFVSTRQNWKVFWRQILMTDYTGLLFFLFIILEKNEYDKIKAIFPLSDLNVFTVNNFCLTTSLSPSHVVESCDDLGVWGALGCDEVWLGDALLSSAAADFPSL